MNDKKRQMPMNDLDLQYMLTDPDWGKDIPEELKQRLSQVRINAVNNEDGTRTYEIEFKDSLWGLLSFYKKEMRLAYLNPTELVYCQHMIDLASDCLYLNLPKSFMRSLSRAITILELSQSKGGFLRKRHNTITTEETKGDLEPPQSKINSKR